MFKFIRDRKELQALKNNSREHAFLSFGQVETVLVLFDSKDINQIINLAKDLRGWGKNVLLWTSISRDENIRPVKDMEGISLRIITPAEKSKWTILPDSVLEEFKALKCDMLLDMSNEGNRSMSYLMSNTMCRFCVGFRETKYPIYDFIFLKENEQDFQDAFKHIKIYLERISNRD